MATTTTVLYLVMLVAMFVLSLAPGGIGVIADQQPDKTWIVRYVVPPGTAYDLGLRTGDRIIDVDGSAPRPSTVSKGDFQGLSRITFVQASNPSAEPVTRDLPTENEDNPIRRWTYALLGLIYIGVGAPVFVRARQRTAASAFYAFCVFSALAFGLAIGIPSNNILAMAAMIVTLVLWATAFAYFFLKFPVPVGKTAKQELLITGSIAFVGICVLAGYALVLATRPENYDILRPFLYLYLMGCVLVGLYGLLRSFTGPKSPEVRQQLTLLLLGVGLAVGPAVMLSIVPTLLFDRPIVGMHLAAVALGILPLDFAYVITQHQLLGMRSFVRRSVVYLIMGSAVLTVFSVAAAGLSAVLPQGWVDKEWGLIGFSFFVFLIAFSFSRLQRRVEHLVDKHIYHDAYDYKDALLQFSSQLASEQELDLLATQLVERTCRLMNLTCGVLVLAVYPDYEARREASPLAGLAGGWGGRGIRAPGAVSLALKGSPPAPSGSNGRGIGSYLAAAGGPHTGEGHHYGIPKGLVHAGLAEAMLALTNWSHENDDADASASRPEDDLVYLQVYAKYGKSADRMIAGLQDELSRLGINLHRSDSPVLSTEMRGDDIYSLTTGVLRGLPSLVDGEGVPRVSTLADAVASSGVSQITPALNLTDPSTAADMENATSFLGVPLWTRSRFVGMLCLAGKRTGERFTRDDLALLSTLGSHASVAIHNAQLAATREQVLLDTIAALAFAIEAKDGYTSEHCERMMDRAVAIAQVLGLPRQEIENVRLGAILHDVGKIGIPDAVLNKPARLTPDEYETMKQHPAIGAGIVQSVGALKGVVPVVLHHQEKYDGTGYPAGLVGEDIPIGARIIGVVDAYGAMTEDRIYRKAPGHTYALSELKMFSGKQFDPVVVEAFIRLLEERPELGTTTPDVPITAPLPQVS
jgi:HD-GYP domain-containing protein (c-di-GMP phosphodiesterase class II)